VIGLGLLGYGMRKLGFEPGPFVLAFVLGSLLEASFRRSMRIFGGDVTEYVKQPVSGTLVAILVLTVVVVPLLRKVRTRQTAGAEAAGVKAD
jgi:putative tricarboxylic transport membrane protein